MKIAEAHDAVMRRSAALKRANPAEWEQFVRAFAAYDFAVTVAVTAAPASEVLIAQGSARQCQALARIFEECELKSTAQ